MKQKIGRKLLGVLLALAMVVGLMPGMGLTAYAADGVFGSYLVSTSDNANALSNKVVKFNIKDWYIIEDKSTAQDAGTVTLLAKNPMGTLKFNNDQNVGNHYNGSVVQNYLKGLTEAEGSFADVADAIVTIPSLTTNGYSAQAADTGETYDTVTNVKLYLLSYSEANALPVNVRKGSFDNENSWWWLRSPGSATNVAALVKGKDGSFVFSGSVDVEHHVRPALKLDLSKVTFDSATKTFSLKPTSYTMTFKPGEGATGNDQQLTATAGADYELPQNMFTVPEGKVFAGWKDTETLTVYNALAIIPSVNKPYTFEAQWKPASQGGDSGGGSGSFVDLVFNIPGEDNSWEYVGGYAPQYAYRVSLAPMQGGSAALGLMTGDSGTALNVYPTTTVFVFPNANPGYVLDKIVWSLIDGSASYDITEAQNFVMPAMDVVVYVTFRPVG